jgi:hypothetical protein
MRQAAAPAIFLDLLRQQRFRRISTLQKPALSMSSQAGSMSSKDLRVANRLWCPSRRINSLTSIVLGITVVRWVGDLAGAK